MIDLFLIEEQSEELFDLIEIDNSLNDGRYIDELKKYQDIILSKSYILDEKISVLEKKIRKSILEKYIGVRYRSPRTSNIKSDDWMEATNFDYERSMAPDYLEKKYIQERNVHPKFSCIYRSGMTALSSTFLTLTSFYKRNLDKLMYSYTTYFEIKTLIDGFIKSCHYNNHYINTVEELYFIVKNEKMDTLFLELMDVSMRDGPVDLEQLKKALLEREEKSSLIVIVDSTLVDDLVDKEQFIHGLPNNIIVIFIQSCLKLNQFGLEFCNMGLMEFYTNANIDRIELKRTFNAFRAVTGTSLDYIDECILLSPLFSKKRINFYCEKLRENVKYMFQQIKDNHIEEIKDINYQENAPFLLLKLIREEKEEYVEFINQISLFLSCRNDEFIYGTSFGFRHTRLELIDHGDYTYSIRISPGRFWTKSTEDLCLFLKGGY